MFRRSRDRNLFDDSGDCPDEMDRMDDRTAERLLQGALASDDAAGGYGGVATLLREARTEARAQTSTRTGETILAMVAAIEQSRAAPPARAPRRTGGRRSRLVAGATAGFAVMFASLTAAGALPASVQDGMSTVLGTVGIDVPRGHDDNGGGPSKADGREGPNGANPHDDQNPATNHGECVSAVAGAGGDVVSEMARSDCGKDPKEPRTGNGPPGGEPPGQTEDKDKTHPTHPPQSNSGGSGGSNGNANGDANGDANGNGNGGGATDKPDK
jgi:hypothetical protein